MARVRQPQVPVRHATPLLEVDPPACAARLRRRIAELVALRDFSDSDDPRFEVVADSIASDVLDIYGRDSPEFERHEHPHIWDGPMYIGGISPQEQSNGRHGGIDRYVAILEGLVTRIDERIADAAAHEARGARSAFGALTIHPRILAACTGQFTSGHYRDAILAAGIALVEYVKERSGNNNADGTALMTTVFSARAPVLAFNDLASQTDRDQQVGLMNLFQGAVQALRNPRAHSLSPDTADYAVEAISVISFLAKHLDTARRMPATP